MDAALSETRETSLKPSLQDTQRNVPTAVPLTETWGDENLPP